MVVGRSEGAWGPSQGLQGLIITLPVLVCPGPCPVCCVLRAACCVLWRYVPCSTLQIAGMEVAVSSLQSLIILAGLVSCPVLELQWPDQPRLATLLMGFCHKDHPSTKRSKINQTSIRGCKYQTLPIHRSSFSSICCVYWKDSFGNRFLQSSNTCAIWVSSRPFSAYGSLFWVLVSGRMMCNMVPHSPLSHPCPALRSTKEYKGMFVGMFGY